MRKRRRVGRRATIFPDSVLASASTARSGRTASASYDYLGSRTDGGCGFVPALEGLVPVPDGVSLAEAADRACRVALHALRREAGHR
jgi:hypothetical protein